jgi:nucleotide-binding universal stress UspA family protein
MAIRKILVPFDFSPHSREATRWAVDLAQRHDASVTLAHVSQPIAFPPGPDGSSILTVDALAEAPRELAAALERARAEVEAEGVRAESCVLDGSPAAEIIELARARGFDLVVMGTHGRGWIAHALLGSVAEKVVRKAPCPVLTVRLPGQGTALEQASLPRGSPDPEGGTR